MSIRWTVILQHLIAAFEQQDDVLALQAQVQQEYNEAMLADENLNQFVTNTLKPSIAKWAADFKAQQEAAAEAAKKEEEAKAAAEAAKLAEEAQGCC